MGDVNFYNTKFDEMVFFVQPSWEVKERIPYFLFFRCNGDFGWKPKNNLNEINQVKVTLHFPAPSRNKTLKPFQLLLSCKSCLFASRIWDVMTSESIISNIIIYNK